MARPGLPLGDPEQVCSGRTQLGAGQRVPLYSTAPASRVFLLRNRCTHAWVCSPSSPRQMGVFAHVGVGQGWGGQEKGGEGFHSLERPQPQNPNFHDFNPCEG